MPQQFIGLVYLGASILFILGLKGLAHPRTAVRGNLLGAAGMLAAIVATLLDHRIVSFEVIIAGIVIGALVGAVTAYRAPMTAMPQVVAVFNGFGGGASALAVGAALEEALKGGFIEQLDPQFTLAAAASGLIGGVSFSGSAVAFGKLQGLLPERPILLLARHAVNIALVVICLVFTAWLVAEPTSSLPFWAMVKSTPMTTPLRSVSISAPNRSIGLRSGCSFGFASSLFCVAASRNTLTIQHR